jgi:hypothetical protein
MNPKAMKFLIQARIGLLSTLHSAPSRAPGAGATLSGKIIDRSGIVVPNAKVSAKNLATGESVETQTDSGGLYRAPNLMPGEYELSVSADGFRTNVAKVIIAVSTQQTMDVALGGVLSVQDLGFSSAQIQESAQDQARLDKRSTMLRIHQRLGLIDTVPLIATVIFGARRRRAPPRDTVSASSPASTSMTSYPEGRHWPPPQKTSQPKSRLVIDSR